LFLMDEATSALDGESEEAIQDALAKLMRGRTVIAIAHRLSTVHNFDRVIVLQSGQVVQDGPPDQLMRHDGVYRSLVLRETSRLAKRGRVVAMNAKEHRNRPDAVLRSPG